MLSALYFAACGSDDGKNIVRNTDGGAGGEAGEPTTPLAGTAGEPPLVNGGAPAGGTGGVGGEGGGGAVAGAAGGEAGAGGQPPVCSGFVTPAEGGAGGEGAVVPLQFRCEDLRDAGAYYDVATHKIVVPALPGMEGAVSGSFTLFYTYTPADAEPINECTVGSVSSNGDELELSAFASDPDAASVSYLDVHQLTLQDECGNTVSMDTSAFSPEIDSCHFMNIFEPSEPADTWSIECYEGFGQSCGTECPTN